MIYGDQGLNMLSTHATLTSGGYSFEGGLAEMMAYMEGGRFKDEAITRVVASNGQTGRRGTNDRTSELTKNRVGLKMISGPAETPSD